MQLQFVGCGDALGSGGRYNTCFHVTGENVNFLVDCGASSLPAAGTASCAGRTVGSTQAFTAWDTSRSPVAADKLTNSTCSGSLRSLLTTTASVPTTVKL